MNDDSPRSLSVDLEELASACEGDLPYAGGAIVAL
jgi:hypothetical protein